MLPFKLGKSIYFNGGIYNSTSGGSYTPPPPPPESSKLLLESGFKFLLENGDFIALED